ncbi:hypothetical protein BDR26DRAFT_921471 [Obelidium mucronatum]|nr:hypothetical protein BDR26DRAFT_921471 [Obelidium mucronatum]
MDSFSINQSPTPVGKQDKSVYIPLMSSIYSMAFCVAAYTQDPNDSIFDTEWYDRVWTLQELVLPKQIFFYRDSVWTTLHEEKMFWATRGYREGKGAINVLSELGGACKGSCLSLAQILKLLEGRGCEKEQDRVYGILGLIPFTVDIPLCAYDTPVQKLWEDLCRQVITKSGDLSLFATHRFSQKGSFWIPQIHDIPEMAHGNRIDWDKTLISQKKVHADKYVFLKSRLVKVERVAPVDSGSRTFPDSVKAKTLLRNGAKEPTKLIDNLEWICTSLFVLQEANEDLANSGALGIFVEGCKAPFTTRLFTNEMPVKEGDRVRIVILGSSGHDKRGLLGIDCEGTSGTTQFKPLCVVTNYDVPQHFIRSDPVELN